MRRKTIIEGFKNSQKFRFILTSDKDEQVGMYITIQQMSDSFATHDARVAVWDALARLSYDRRVAEACGRDMPTGVVRGCYGFKQVQVDLV